MSVKFTVVINKEDNWYVATCFENSVSSQGSSIEEALENLREALALYYEDNPETIPTNPVFVTTLEVAV